MQVLPTVDTLRDALEPHRRKGYSIGLVPTMGALHPGHLSLVAAGAAGCDTVVVSVFVNPLQFGAGEDLEAYPRDLERDLALLEPAGAHLVFAPDPASFTPPERRTTVHVSGLTEVLEGISRQGHLDGVTTIVAKLLGAVRPDRAYFGEKDYQQLVTVRRMATDLHLGEIVGCPIVRAADGLALSSRNAYLSPSEREQALALSRMLFEAADNWDGDADAARRRLRSTLAAAPGVALDYAEVVDPETLTPLEGVVSTPARALVAARVGTTRLIDNIRLGEEGA